MAEKKFFWIKLSKAFFESKEVKKHSSVTELSELLGISKPTLIARMKEPWARFTYDDLLAIAEHFRIDFVQMLTGEIKIG